MALPLRHGTFLDFCFARQARKARLADASLEHLARGDDFRDGSGVIFVRDEGAVAVVGAVKGALGEVFDGFGFAAVDLGVGAGDFSFGEDRGGGDGEDGGKEPCCPEGGGGAR